MSKIDWKYTKDGERYIIVDLKKFEKTDLEREIDREFGTRDRSIYDDVVSTYREAKSEYGTLNIKIRTDVLEPQIYKSGGAEIEIINGLPEKPYNSSPFVADIGTLEKGEKRYIEFNFSEKDGKTKLIKKQIMKEQEYVNTKALGTITAAINVLKDLTPENLKNIIKDGEKKKVFGTLHDWQDRLFKEIEISEKLEFIEFEGHKYWYEYRLAKDRKDMCLATKDPKKYCNGIYKYSTKDPGNGMAFVIVDTDEPELKKYLKLNN